MSKYGHERTRITSPSEITLHQLLQTSHFPSSYWLIYPLNHPASLPQWPLQRKISFSHTLLPAFFYPLPYLLTSDLTIFTDLCHSLKPTLFYQLLQTSHFLSSYGQIIILRWPLQRDFSFFHTFLPAFFHPLLYLLTPDLTMFTDLCHSLKPTL